MAQRATGDAGARPPGSDDGDRPGYQRDEVVALQFAVYDILAELRRIRRALEDDGEEEEDLGE